VRPTKPKLEVSKNPNLEDALEIQARERVETGQVREGQNDFLEPSATIAP
jgi:hypothetical protein